MITRLLTLTLCLLVASADASLIVVSGGGGGQSSGGGEGGELWDLWGERSAPSEFSALAWPTAPNTGGNTDSVSNLTNLNTEVDAGTSTVTLDAGTYSGNVSIDGNDVHLILTGSTITGELSISGTRVRVTGGRFNHSTVVGISTDDVLLYNVNLVAQSSGVFTSNGNSSIEISNGVNRLALVLTTVFNDYSARVIYQNAVGGSTTTDLIIAGSELIGTNSNGWAARINGCTRCVIVDTRALVTSPSQTNRYHADDESVVTGYYAARNQVEEGTWNNDPFSSTGLTGGDMDGVYFYDNNFYRNSSDGQLAFGTSGQGSMDNIEVHDNTHYTLAGGGSGNMEIQTGGSIVVDGYTASNNVRAPYETPPSFAYGSDQ